MSAIVKGDPSAQLIAVFPNYNSETKVYTETHEYRGIESAIRGLENQFQLRGLSYRITHDGPVWTLQVEIPNQEIDEQIDRWEIFTESTEKSFFELPEAIVEANAWDANVVADEELYRKSVERSAEKRNNEFSASWPTAVAIINHLKAGVTGWQHDLLVIRRTRRMERYVGSSFQMSLDDGLKIYTTGQLRVPVDVGFTLPPTPTVDASITIYSWGWRKRSQRVEAIGQYIEQTVELVFAPWSTLSYSPATANLIW